MVESKNNHTTLISSVVSLIFFNLLLIDSINGALLNANIPVQISMVFKLILIIYLLKYYAKYPNNTSRIVFTVVYFIFLLIYFISIGVESISASFSPYLRFFIMPLSMLYFTQKVKQDPIAVESFGRKVFIINAFVLAANIVLSIMGYGYHSYGEDEDGIGNKGFFYAANEVSSLIILLFGMCAYYARLRYSNIKFYAIVGVLFILAVSFGTKTGMLGFLLVVLYIISHSAQSKKQNKIVLICGSVLMLLGLFYYGYKLTSESGILDRWMYFFDRSDDVFAFLLSDRDLYWQEEKQDLMKAGWVGWIFGLGDNRTVEMDPFDVLLNYGIVGLFVIYPVWYRMIKKTYKCAKTNPFAKFVLFVDIELLCISTLSGHTIMSGMLTPFLALFNAMALMSYKRI